MHRSPKATDAVSLWFTVSGFRFSVLWRSSSSNYFELCSTVDADFCEPKTVNRKPPTGAPNARLKEIRHKVFFVEVLEIFQLFTCANESRWDPQFVLNRDGDSAFARAVQLGYDNAS